MLVYPHNKLFNLQLMYLTVNKKRGAWRKNKILEWQVFIFWSFDFSNIGFIQTSAIFRYWLFKDRFWPLNQKSLKIAMDA